MITALSITIVLACGQVQAAYAEVGKQAFPFTPYEVEIEDGEIRYQISVKDRNGRLAYGINEEMRRRGMAIRTLRKDGDCV